MNTPTVQEAWTDYYVNAVGGAKKNMIRGHLKSSFYAGAFLVLGDIFEVISDPNKTEAQLEEYIARMHAEMTSYHDANIGTEKGRVENRPVKLDRPR